MNAEIGKKGVAQKITLIDGIAIFCIVLYHELGGKNTPDANFLTPYLVIFGLCLFTFTAGFKLHLNHSNEITDKYFLTQYSKKRFVRLCKPYIGYTILSFIPVYLTIYFAENYLNLQLTSFDSFNSNLNFNGLIHILSGQNFVSGQLWYLIALLGITLIVFLVLYIARIKGIILLFSIVVLYDLFFDSQYYIPAQILKWLPIYIFGILFSHKLMYDPKNKTTIAFSIIFLVILFFSDIVLHYFPTSKVILIGVTFPCFIYTSSSLILKQKSLAQILEFFGKNSFYIYLFHWPLALPILDRLLMTYFQFNFFMLPYLITIMSMVLCIYIYIFCKKIQINRIFE